VKHHDLLVVGAGINGAGVARDAALRGLDVLLVDKGDVAAGTTSWSTRLIHGGLRYLEHLEVGLVRESLHERERLLRIAPHLVHPLAFFLPVYAGDKRGKLTVRAGMLAYDAFTAGDSMPHHGMLSAEEALRREPGLDPADLRGAAVYYDAQAEFPERLAVENVIAAERAGAEVRTHTEVRELLHEQGAVVGARLATGAEIRAQVTVNLTGPWVDEVLAGLGERAAPGLVGGTKGAHIIVDAFPGAPEEALYVEASDGRPYFVVPWNGLFLIGTTDTPYHGDLDDVEASAEEIEYLLAATNDVIPTAQLTRNDVLHTYAGVRPLPEVPEGGDAGAITRRHLIHDHAPALENLLSVVGGKLTTYRALAEEVVDAVAKKLGRELPPARTASEALPGATATDDRRPGRLGRIYGARGDAVRALAQEHPGLAEPFDPVTGALAAEVVLAIDEEHATTLADVLMRRTMVGLGAHAGVGPDEAAARVAQRHLGWDEARVRDEVEAFRAGARRRNARALRDYAAACSDQSR
jgi:glycerol-3-phosphate dehydrogenase